MHERHRPAVEFGWTDYSVDVTARVEHSHDTDLVEELAQRVVVDDGAMGTRLQATDLDPPDEVDDRGGRRDAKYVRLQSG